MLHVLHFMLHVMLHLLLANFRPRISHQESLRRRREASRERFLMTSEPPRHREG